MTSEATMAEYGFTLSGVGLPGGENPLGLWDVPQDDAVSFSAGASAPAELTWRIELPESPAEAQAILTSQVYAMELAQRDLVNANRDLTHIGRTKVVSFSASDPLLAQKTELLATMNTFQFNVKGSKAAQFNIKGSEAAQFNVKGSEAAQSPVSAASATQYSLFKRENKEKESEDQKSHQQWLAFVERVRQTVANYARIETALAGLNVGQTAVGWTGNFATTWAPNVTIEMMRTHQQSVHLALDSRIALIRVVSVVATGAAGLAIKAAIPGGQVLLLPAVWRFVRDVLAELRKSWPKFKYLH